MNKPIISARTNSHRLFIWFVIILVTLFFTIIFVYLWQDEKQERFRDMKYTHSVIKRYYELSFNQWRNTLINVGERLLDEDGPDRDSIRLTIVNESIKNYPELLAFGLADTSGQVVTFSGRVISDSLPNLMKSEDSRRSFLKAKESDYVSIGESYFFENVDDWILPIRVPIRDFQGNLLALNTTALAYSSLHKDLNSFDFDENYMLTLVNDHFNSIQLVHPKSAFNYEDLLGTDNTIFKLEDTIKVGKPILAEAENNLYGHSSYVFFGELTHLNHTLFVSVNKNVIWKNVQGDFVLLLIAYIFLVFVLWLSYQYSLKKQKQYLQELEESEANLKSIFESTNSLIGLFNENQILIEYNQAFALYASQTDNIKLEKNQDVLSLMNPQYADLFRAYQKKALKGEKFSETIEYGGENESLYFKFNYNPIYRGSNVVGVSMFVEDVTQLIANEKKLEHYSRNLEKLVDERTEELMKKNSKLEEAYKELQQTQNQLIRSEKMASLGVLVAGIAHEINNPLNFIKNGVLALQNLLKQEGKLAEETSQTINIITEGAERAKSIVKSLRHFSHHSQDDRDFKACDIHEIIRNCLLILDNNFKNRVDINLNLEPDALMARGISGELHQVFLNLLSNAEQAIEEKGQISIETKSDSDNAYIVIADSGCGIDEDKIAKITDPFFTTKEPGAGTGLGLYICLTIIDKHRGNISFESTPGKGTEVRLTLPKNES